MNSSFHLVRGEDLRVRGEADQRARLRLRVLALLVGDELAFPEDPLVELALAKAHDLELRGERVHRLGADAVQANGELEHVVVELSARVDLADAVDDLAQRDAAAVVADRHRILLASDVDDLSLAHDELVDAVVDDFLQQYIDAVHGIGAVAQPSDIHARAQPDVLQRVEGLYRFLVVFHSGFRHMRPYRFLRGKKPFAFARPTGMICISFDCKENLWEASSGWTVNRRCGTMP